MSTKSEEYIYCAKERLRDYSPRLPSVAVSAAVWALLAIYELLKERLPKSGKEGL